MILLSKIILTRSRTWIALRIAIPPLPWQSSASWGEALQIQLRDGLANSHEKAMVKGSLNEQSRGLKAATDLSCRLHNAAADFLETFLNCFSSSSSCPPNITPIPRICVNPAHTIRRMQSEPHSYLPLSIPASRFSHSAPITSIATHPTYPAPSHSSPHSQKPHSGQIFICLVPS